MQKTLKDQNWQEQKALERYTLIAPLLDESLDPDKLSTVMNRHTVTRAFQD